MDVQAKSFLAIPRNDRWHGGRLDNDLVRETIERTGAFIMGKRMFDEGEANWLEDLYKAPEYVLTNEKRAPWVQKGSTTFYFIHSALEKARASAGGKDIRIQGGAGCDSAISECRLGG